MENQSIFIYCEGKKINLNRQRFSLSNLRKLSESALKKALEEVGISEKPFPKSKVKWLSYYTYKPQELSIIPPNGKAQTIQIKGGPLGMLLSLVDFSFIRWIISDEYSSIGNPECYDPVSLFLLALSYAFHQYHSYIDYHQLAGGKNAFAREIKSLLGFDKNVDSNSYESIKKDEFVKSAVGLKNNDFPALSVMCDFVSQKLTPKVLIKIFHVISSFFINLLNVEDARFTLIYFDGKSFPGQSVYKGCNQYENTCANIEINLADWSADIKRQLNEHPEKVEIGKEHPFFVKCPFIEKWQDSINQGKSIPQFQLFRYSFIKVDEPFYSDNPSSDSIEEQIVYRMGLTTILNQFKIRMIISHSKIVSFPQNNNCCVLKCPKIPSDFASRFSVKRSKLDPDDLVFIFGYNLIILVVQLPMLQLELPIAYTVIEGNANEGEQIKNLIEEQLKKFRNLKKGEIKVIGADSRFDIQENYEYSRSIGAKPVIDYNPRNESFPKFIKKSNNSSIKLSKRFLPFAHCNLEMTPDGYDENTSYTKYRCAFACQNYLKNPCPNCNYLSNRKEQKISLKVYPSERTILEIPRNSPTYKTLYSLRTGNERLNSIAENLGISSKRYLKPQTNRAKGGLVAIAILTKKLYLFFLKNQIILNHIHQGKKDRKHAYFDAMNPLLERFFPPKYKGVRIESDTDISLS